MDYKQHKGNLRGQIKDKVQRKLYNKQIRAVGKNVDTSDGQLTIPDVSNSFCDLYKKKCMGGFCSVTPFPEKCIYLKQNDC